jgi:hypothetical protein
MCVKIMNNAVSRQPDYLDCKIELQVADSQRRTTSL